ncbi:MAG: TetR/AcrR family transcriptional regulator [Caulobacteraceae bacterium]|nr:MAG: TetR/AcrR family transcriptional regulator [Caulobacteraceae bacterium]
MLAPCQRPRNAAATREAILKAANRRFSAEGYDQVGVRDVAGDVGVDPALISRYFGSKEDLFIAVMEDCGNGSTLTDGPRQTFGERVAHDLVYGPKKEGKLEWLLILLRSISSPKAAEIVQRQSKANFYQPFTDWVGGENAVVRARLAGGFIMGLAISRDLTGGFDMKPEECDAMYKRLAVVLQDLIDG